MTAPAPKMEDIKEKIVIDWKHKDEWKIKGTGFCVVISRHEVPVFEDDIDQRGRNRWAVYAYIYPSHWHFKKFSGNDMWQEAASEMPLHGGPTFLEWHRNNKAKICSVQVGADYNHLHDANFTHYATKEDALSVFNDAERLVEWLENTNKAIIGFDPLDVCKQVNGAYLKLNGIQNAS